MFHCVPFPFPDYGPNAPDTIITWNVVPNTLFSTDNLIQIFTDCPGDIELVVSGVQSNDFAKLLELFDFSSLSCLDIRTNARAPTLTKDSYTFFSSLLVNFKLVSSVPIDFINNFKTSQCEFFITQIFHT
jgi:hypothetical protein